MKIHKLITLLGLFAITAGTMNSIHAKEAENVEKTSTKHKRKHAKKDSKKLKKSKHFQRVKKDADKIELTAKKGLAYEEAEINEYLDLV